MTDASQSMQVLSLVNQKGGCGKTTTAVNLAGALAARGESVLLIDLDPQSHATMALGCALEEGPGEPSVAEVLLDEALVTDAIQSRPGGIDLLPSKPLLAEFEEISERLIHPEQRLAVCLEAVRDRYRWAVVDCPPRADGVLCANALFASDTALLVVETGAFALQGALQALRVLERAGEHHDRTYPVRVVGTMFDRRTRFARELLVALHGRFGEAMFDTVIRTSVRLREAPAVGLPIQELAPTSRAAADFAALAEEIQEKLRREPSPESSTESSTGPSTGPSTESSTGPSTESSTGPSTESSTGPSTGPSSKSSADSSAGSSPPPVLSASSTQN